MRNNQKVQQGFSAIIVVVLIVLFALLGTYMVSMSSISSLNTTQSRGAMQVWFAARSGVEWAVHQSLAAVPGCTCAIDCCTGINGQTINFTEQALNGYSATITCVDQSFSEASANYCVFNLGSAATNNGSAQLTSVARTINLSITDRTAP